MDEKKLISIPPIEKRIPNNVYNELENIILVEVNKYENSKEILEQYEFPFENIQKIAESDNVEYKENIRKMADDLCRTNHLRRYLLQTKTRC